MGAGLGGVSAESNNDMGIPRRQRCIFAARNPDKVKQDYPTDQDLCLYSGRFLDTAAKGLELWLQQAPLGSDCLARQPWALLRAIRVVMRRERASLAVRVVR